MMRRLLQWVGTMARGANRRLGPAIAILALVVLSFVGGAAVMYFGLPSSGFLARAFMGAEVWAEGGSAAGSMPGGALAGAAVTRDQPAATYDGFTLITTTGAPEATLLDMEGRVVHYWKMPFRRAWPRASHVREPFPEDPLHWDRCHLFPNGDVLVLCCSGSGTPYGYALAKFDKDSRLLWAYSCNAHHDFDVGDDGKIYLLTQRFDATGPPELDFVSSRFVADDLVVLSADGQEIDTIPLLESFVNAPYLPHLVSSNTPDPRRAPGLPDAQPSGPLGGPPPGLPAGVPSPFGQTRRTIPTDPGDILHANSVKVLKAAQGPRFPQFKAGQVLVSFRTPGAIAVLDLPARRVVWSARGPWQLQHDARFLDNGNLLLFDNCGGLAGARVLEYDPATQAVPWSFAGDKGSPLTTLYRGGSQRLPNGNTLVMDSEAGRLLEVTPGKAVIWQWSCRAKTAVAPRPGAPELHLTSACRFGPGQLTFLAADQRPRAEQPAGGQ